MITALTNGASLLIDSSAGAVSWPRFLGREAGGGGRKVFVQHGVRINGAEYLALESPDVVTADHKTRQAEVVITLAALHAA